MVIFTVGGGIRKVEDIRRMLNKYENINGLTAKDIMTSNPKTIDIDKLAIVALEKMQDNGISQLLAVKNSEYKGILQASFFSVANAGFPGIKKGCS